tara:strand:- start:874 stop:1254 length:381 start_codon:yes stop_codon:yes gene_type:complete
MRQSLVDAQPPKMRAAIAARIALRNKGSLGTYAPIGSDVKLVAKVEWVAQGVRDGDDLDAYARKSRWCARETGRADIDQLVKERIVETPEYLRPPMMEADMLQALIDAGADPEPYFESGKWSRPSA